MSHFENRRSERKPAYANRQKSRVRLALIAGACLIGVSSLAAPGAAAAASVPQAAVLRSTLSNGLRVVIVQNRLAPVVTTMVNYLVGSNESPKGFPGMAHAQEHMMFRGSPGLSRDQLTDIDAAMGGSFNADTQQMVTQYFFTVPATELNLALHVQSVRMRGVLDSQEQWEKERGAIEQEVAQDMSNPGYVFYTKLLAAMFAGTPLEVNGLGTRPSFDKTTATMLKDFYDSWYAPNNAILVIVGDVEPAKTLRAVKNLFSGIPAKTLPARPAIQLNPVKSESLKLTTDYPYGLCYTTFRMPGAASPDYAAAQVLSDVLSSQRGTLYALVPEGKALYAGFGLFPLPQASIGFAVAVFPKGADGEKLNGELRQILEEDLKNGVPADLVAAAKRSELTSAALQKNSVSGLAAAWSQAVAVEGRHSPDEDVAAIERVTVDDVNRVAREYLSFDHAIFAVLTPQPSGKPISSKSFGGQESFAPKEAKAVALPSWAVKALHKLEVPKTVTNPVVSTLPNGIKLIVQPENVSNTISVIGHIKNDPDLETPHGQEGVSSALSRLFSYGSVTLDRIAFQKALDEIGASESAGANFSVEVLADHFDRGVELLADNELRPGLPGRAFAIIKPQLARTVAGELQSPDFLSELALDTALYPKSDPTLRHATPESVSSLSLADVKSYYERTFRPDLTTIVVIGMVTPKEAKAVITKYFSSWRASGPPPPTTLPAVPANDPSATHVPDSSRVQVSVTLAETVNLNRFNPDYYALALGNSVLGGGFYASRFYRDVRENAGLAYYVTSSLNAGKTRTVYSAAYGCDPPNVSKARAIIVRDLKAMQTTPVSPAELRGAKALLLRSVPLSESSFASIAHGWIARSDIGLPLNEPEVAARRYMKLTAAQVEAAFAKWLRPDDLVQITQGPAPK